MREEFDVVIVGAGSAGLSAVKEVRKLTPHFLLVDRGPLGTTCSRVGCMPSKAFIQLAHDYSRTEWLKDSRLLSGDTTLHFPKVMDHVRGLRDHFVAYALKEIEALGSKFVKAEAQFVGPNTLEIGSRTVHAKAVILATGSRPTLPQEWADLGSKVLTTDSFFELQDLQKDWAVIGLGALGLELGAALAKFGRKVTAYNKSEIIGGLKDPEVLREAKAIFSRFIDLKLGEEVELSRAGEKIRVKTSAGERTFDHVLVGAGRKANLVDLDLEKALCELDEKGLPYYDPHTLQAKCKDPAVKLFLAGDFAGDRPILHEAADEGRIAGYNALQSTSVAFKRRTPMTVTFSLPNLAAVGDALSSLKNPLVGSVSFADQGRSKIMAENEGILRIYADRDTGLLRGAELCGPEGEHLAHLLAGAITQKLGVRDLLRQPFYHPTVEEGLRTALRQIDKAMDIRRIQGPELERLEFE